jgi:pimeloyl-ACP methyl ester carboxylesterase
MDYAASESDIQAPTLVLGGERDTVFAPSEQQALAALVNGAALRLLPEIGHSPHWENPVQFVLEVVAFVEQTRGAYRCIRAEPPLANART